MDENGTRMGILGGGLSRRTVLRGAGLGLGGVAGGILVGCGDDGARKVDLTDESLPPEVTRIRLPSIASFGWGIGASLCTAPLALAPDFFPAEGLAAEFMDTPPEASWPELVDEGTFDIGQDFMSSAIITAASRRNLTFLTGVHSGCVELFAREGINSPGDLAGKRIAVTFGGTATQSDYAFMVTLMNFVGLPADRTVSSHDVDQMPGLLQSDAVDAVLAYQPTAENLRGLKGVHVILSMTDDRPWSNYYCCALLANQKFVRKNPVATKRMLRAVMKATDMLAQEPERASARLVDISSVLDPKLDYEQVLRFVKHLPYGLWRSVNPEDSLRFWALRLKEIGEIKKTPDQIIKSADWRFLNQIKRDMAYAPVFPQRRGAFALDCEVEPAADIAGPRQA